MATDEQYNNENDDSEFGSTNPTLIDLHSLPAGTTLGGRYVIERELGRGGIGVVYLARDQQLLSKPVVVKLLLEESQHSQWAVTKFRQELEALSRLEHPGIVRVLDSGETHDGKLYLVMQHVQGAPLRSLLSAEGIDLKLAANIIKQIGSALVVAHNEGICHRDLKPENIMVQITGEGESWVKLIDFGIAKVKNSSVAPSTVMPTVAGTIAYMSPEQLQARHVSNTSDIYSLGIIAYEMVTGRRPFNPDSAYQLLEMQKAGIRVKPQDLRPSLPKAAEEAILKALTYETKSRYQNVRDFTEAFAQAIYDDSNSLAQSDSEPFDSRVRSHETWLLPRAGNFANLLKSKTNTFVTAVVMALAVTLLIAYYFKESRAATIDSLAVMPFDNMDADPEIEYLSDGITESLINNLSRLTGMKVISRNSVFRYKGKEIEPKTAAREMGVQVVLTGRIRRVKDKLVINANLIKASDNTNIWGNQYISKPTDILSVQEEVTRQISETLRERLSGEEKQRVTKNYTHNAEAYKEYLKGRYFWNKRTHEGFKKALESFQRAIDIDPNYALAYTGVADTYALLSDYTFLPPNEAMPKARAAAERALELDETLAEAHTSLAHIKKAYDYDFAAAEREYRRAIELNPNYATAHHWYSWYLAEMKRFDEAQHEIRRARELDPLSLVISNYEGLIYYAARDYDKAIIEYRQTLEMDANFPGTFVCLADSYEQKGMYDEAVRELQKALRILEGEDLSQKIGDAYERSGIKGVREIWLGFLKEKSKRTYVSPWDIALAHANLGEKDKAFEFLEKAYAERCRELNDLQINPYLDSLRSDPRFSSLLLRSGFSHK